MKSLKDQKKFRDIKAGDMVKISGLDFQVRSAVRRGRIVEVEVQENDGAVITISGLPGARILLA